MTRHGADANPEVLPTQLIVARDFLRLAGKQNRTLVHDQKPLRDAQRKIEILLHQQDRHALFVQALDDLADFLD
jgi:hypothetical protein